MQEVFDIWYLKYPNTKYHQSKKYLEKYLNNK